MGIKLVVKATHDWQAVKIIKPTFDDLVGPGR